MHFGVQTPCFHTTEQTKELEVKPRTPDVSRRFCLPLTCQMLTIFSMADAKYFPVTLQASEAKQCSPGEPREFSPSSEELSLTADRNKQRQLETLAWWQETCTGCWEPHPHIKFGSAD